MATDILPEDKRKQLDEIVSKMTQNNESDFNIKFVVDDFKKKYITTEKALPQEQTKGIFDTVIDNPITRGIQKFFPGEKVGEAIGTAGGLALTAIKEKLGLTPEGTTEAFDVSAPSPLQVGGDILQGAATVAGFKGVGTAGPFVQRLLTNIGLGGAISGGGALAGGKEVKEVAKSTALGGAIGGVIPIAGKALRAIGDQIDNLPNRFVESALGRSKKEVLNEIRKGGDSLAKYVLENKPIGTAETMLRNADDSVSTLGNKINTQLSQAITKGGKIATIGRDNFLDTITQLPEAQGALMKRADVRGIIEKLAPQAKQLLQKSSWTVEEANKLRQLLDRTLGDRGFLSSQLSTDKLILRSFANSLRETVKTKAPEGIRGLFTELANEIKLRDALLEKVAQKAGNQVLSFGDFIGGGLGGIFGSLGAQPVAGAVLGVGTRRLIESVPFKIGAAKVVNALTKAGPILEQLAPAQQTAILNLFSEILSSDENEK